MSVFFMRANLRFLLALALLGFGTAFADQPSNNVSQRLPVHHAMSPQYTEHMLQLMRQMRNNVALMSDLMEKHQMMSQTNLSQAAQLMANISGHMQEMSRRMQQGQFDDKTVALMQKHNLEMTRKVRSFQHSLETSQ